MPITRKNVIKVLIATIWVIVVLALMAALLKWFLLPRLPTEWQSNVFWLVSTLITSITILASIAQLSGYGLKDFFSKPKGDKLQPKKIKGSVVFNSYNGKIDFNGDILQDKSTKIVIEHATVVTESEKDDNLENLKRDIRANLYKDNNLLPYALSLCLELCDKKAISNDFRGWIERELKGYDVHEKFKATFRNEEQYEKWMKKWASHRYIESYIKASVPSEDKRYFEIRGIPLGEMFVAFPIAQIVRMLSDEKVNGEFSIQLGTFGKERVSDLRNYFASYSGVDIPPDLLLFYRASELEKVLNGVREKVLDLLK